jgi:hypothetical protein
MPSTSFNSAIASASLNSSVWPGATDVQQQTDELGFQPSPPSLCQERDQLRLSVPGLCLGVPWCAWEEGWQALQVIDL